MQYLRESTYKNYFCHLTVSKTVATLKASSTLATSRRELLVASVNEALLFAHTLCL